MCKLLFLLSHLYIFVVSFLLFSNVIDYDYMVMDDDDDDDEEEEDIYW